MWMLVKPVKRHESEFDKFPVIIIKIKLNLVHLHVDSLTSKMLFVALICMIERSYEARLHYEKTS